MKNISKTTKTVLFASILTAMLLPFSAIQQADASIAAPVMDGINTGLKMEWNLIVDHDRNQRESRADSNICGQNFYVNGFYDTKYNKRGASYQFPSTINGLCNIDADLSGYVNLQLDRVDYRLQGDGNTTILGNADSSSWYKFWNNGYGNSGNEYITITAYYKHVA